MKKERIIFHKQQSQIYSTLMEETMYCGPIKLLNSISAFMTLTGLTSFKNLMDHISQDFEITFPINLEGDTRKMFFVEDSNNNAFFLELSFDEIRLSTLGKDFSLDKVYIYSTNNFELVAKEQV